MTKLLAGALIGITVGCSPFQSSSRSNAEIPPWEAELSGEIKTAHLNERNQIVVPPRAAAQTPPNVLHASRLIGDTLEFGRINALRFLDDSTLIVADGTSLHHIKVVDLNAGAIRSQFGRHGRGPGELHEPRWIFRDAMGRGVWVFDYQVARLIGYEVHGPNSGRTWADQTLSIGTLYREPLVREDRILTNGYFANHTLSEVTLDGNQIRHLVVSPPASGLDIPNVMGRIHVNRNRLVQHPTDGRFALLYQSEPRVDLFTADGVYESTGRAPVNANRSFRIEDHPTAGRRLVWAPDNEHSYVAAAASKDHIFGLFCGRCALRKESPREIHRFDWSGTFLGIILLDREISQLEVSEDGRYAWGATDAPHPLIGEWKLPEVR